MAKRKASVSRERTPPDHVPYSIFTIAQMKMYHYWLRDIKKRHYEKQSPPFPTPLEYQEFLEFASPGQTFINLAVCLEEHKRHTSSTAPGFYCPVYNIEIYLQYIHVVQEAWAEVGGPWPRGKKTAEFIGLKHVWRYARCELDAEMRVLEEAKKDEVEWEEQHLSKGIKGNYSSGRALEVAENRIRNLGLWGLKLEGEDEEVAEKLREMCI